MEFMDVIEQIKSDQSNLVSGFEQGFAPVNDFKRSPKYVQNLTEALRLVEGIQSGKVRPYVFQEAMTRSDFPLYFGDILDRSVLANYKAAGVNWRMISQVGQARDFRNKRILSFDGPDQFLSEQVGEKQEYPMSRMGEATQMYNLFKLGRVFDISWESMINDDLNIFQRIPADFARAAVRTEERFHTGLYTTVAGPSPALYTAPGANVVNGNLGTGVLNVNNLGIAIASMGMLVDPENNEPILNEPRFLVIPPALKLTAERILNSVNLVWQVAARNAAGAADSVRPFPTGNFLKDKLQIIVNPYLPLIDQATGMSAWYLFASPTDVAATEVGFLRGYESPQIFIRKSDQQRVGGGDVSPLDGDFMTDNIMYKIRHILGGTQIRPATATRGNVATYASTGTTATITNYPNNAPAVEPVA